MKPKPNIQIKRVYETPSPKDGLRILVDRLWPRRLTKQKAKIDIWAKEISPSTKLRQWYAHDPDKWKEFKRRYFAELNDNKELVLELKETIKNKTVTFLFSSKEAILNNAQALKEFFESV